MLVYTAALLLAPLPVMPFAPGTRQFAWAVGACGVVLAAASYYVARGEWRLGRRGLLGNKLLAASLVTLAFGMALAAGAVPGGVGRPDEKVSGLGPHRPRDGLGEQRATGGVAR